MVTAGKYCFVFKFEIINELLHINMLHSVER
jgi:hypothetical protein